MAVNEIRLRQRPYIVRLWRHYREYRKFFNHRDALRCAIFIARKHMT